MPLEGIFTVNDEWDYIQDIRENGYNLGLSIDIEDFDKHYKYRLGELDLVTGMPNHGKTTYQAWEMVLTAVMFGWKWAVYSPENYPAGEFYISLIEAYLAKSISKSEEGATDAEMRKQKIL